MELLFFPLHVGSVYFCFFLITLKYVYFLMHLCFFVDPPPVNGILLFPLHGWVRLRFLNVFLIHICFFLDPLKYIVFLIHFCFFIDPSPSKDATRGSWPY